VAFKYQTDINAVQHCPPANVVSEDSKAYRFVHSPLTAASFTPIAKTSPSRPLSGKSACLGLGLSFYNTREAAENKFTQITKTHPNFHKKVGNKIASGVLTKNQGVRSKISTDGHFTFFEFANLSLEKLFQITEIEVEETHG